MTLNRLDRMWGRYGEAFRLHAHQLLLWAHGDVRDRFHPGLDEPSMTGLLADAMKRRLSEHPGTPKAFDCYWIGDQEPHSPAGELGNDRLRLDITIIRNGIRPRITYVLEAKRLRTGGFPIGEYVGEGGMGDLVSGRYAADAPEAAMVGLFENQTVSYWHDELRRRFDQDTESPVPQLSIMQGLVSKVVLADLAGELESRHGRADGSVLILHHIFLDCSCRSAPSGP